MGVILDSSVMIAAQRGGETPESLIQRVLDSVGSQPVALAAIGYTELVHGVYRSDTAVRRKDAQTFLDEVTAELPVFPYTKEVAEIAGQIDAEQKLIGCSIPFADLLIRLAPRLCYPYCKRASLRYDSGPRSDLVLTDIIPLFSCFSP